MKMRWGSLPAVCIDCAKVKSSCVGIKGTRPATRRRMRRHGGDLGPTTMRALKTYLERAEIKQGPAFRGPWMLSWLFSLTPRNGA